MTITAIETQVGVGLPNFVAACMQRGWLGTKPRHLCPCGTVAKRKVCGEWVCEDCIRKDAVAVALLAEIHASNQFQPEVVEDEPLPDNPD